MNGLLNLFAVFAACERFQRNFLQKWVIIWKYSTLIYDLISYII